MPKNHMFSNLGVGGGGGGGGGGEFLGIFGPRYIGDDFLLGPRYIEDDFFFRVDRSFGAKQEGPMIVHF